MLIQVSLDLQTFLTECFAECTSPTDAGLAARLSPTSPIYVSSSTAMKTLKKILVGRKAESDPSITFTDTNIVNYVYFALLHSKQIYLPPAPNTYAAPPFQHAPPPRRPLASQPLKLLAPPLHRQLPLSGRPHIMPQRSPYEISLKHPLCAAARLSEVEQRCAGIIVQQLPHVGNRLFVNALFGHEEASRLKNRAAIEDLEDRIIKQFSLMLKKIAWMDAETKTIAQSKLDKLLRNTFYSAISFDDAKLDNYYSLLMQQLATTGDFLEQRLIIEHFVQTRLLLTLLAPVDKTDISDTSQANGLLCIVRSHQHFTQI